MGSIDGACSTLVRAVGRCFLTTVGLIAQTRRRTVCGMLSGVGLQRRWRHAPPPKYEQVRGQIPVSRTGLFRLSQPPLGEIWETILNPISVLGARQGIEDVHRGTGRVLADLLREPSDRSALPVAYSLRGRWIGAG